MINWMDILKQAVENQASDVFFVAGKGVCQKVEGHILPMTEERLMPADTEQVITELYRAAGRSMEQYLQRGDDDYSFSLPALARFRVNTYRQRGSMAAVIRVVSPPTIKGWFASFSFYRGQNRLRNVEPLAQGHMLVSNGTGLR